MKDMKDPFKKLQLKTYVIISILIMSIPGILQFGYQNTMPQMIFAVLAASFLDLLINKLKKGPTYFFPTSGIISGLIISTILVPGSVWYVPVVGAAIAILSKHVLRMKFNNFWNHVFNPANFALFVLILIGLAKDSWWIGTNPLLVAILGLFVLWRLKKISIVVPFLLFFILSTSVTSMFVSGQTPNLQNLFKEVAGGSLLFFMFIMVQEPITAPRKRNSRIIFGSVVGVLVPLLLAMPATGFISIYLSLLIGNLLAPVLNRI